MTITIRLRDLILAVVLLTATVLGCSLGGGTTPALAADEEAAINALIDEFQNSYSARDYTRLRAVMHPKANVAIDYQNSAFQRTLRADEWITETEELLRNKRSVKDVLSNREITVYRNIATIAADYDYRADGDHQAGKDIMLLIKFGGSWKIYSLTFYGDPVG